MVDVHVVKVGHVQSVVAGDAVGEEDAVGPGAAADA